MVVGRCQLFGLKNYPTLVVDRISLAHPPYFFLVGKTKTNQITMNVQVVCLPFPVMAGLYCFTHIRRFQQDLGFLIFLCFLGAAINYKPFIVDPQPVVRLLRAKRLNVSQNKDLIARCLKFSIEVDSTSLIPAESVNHFQDFNSVLRWDCQLISQWIIGYIYMIKHDASQLISQWTNGS